MAVNIPPKRTIKEQPDRIRNKGQNRNRPAPSRNNGRKLNPNEIGDNDEKKEDKKRRYWTSNARIYEYINQNYLYDIALVILMFVLVYVAGLINYLIVDWLWGVIRLRNNPCMIKSSLNDKVQSKKYIKLAELIKRLNSDNKEICDLN